MRYYFHLRESGDYVVDEEGLDLPDMAGVVAAATLAARSVIAGEAIAGKVPLRSVIEVDDESGERVLTLPFREAVQMEG